MGKKLLGLVRLGPVALAISGVAFAQTTGTIFGVVTDASTGKAIAGALVVAMSPNLQGEQTATTDEKGHYRLILLPAGEYRLAVQRQGYQPAERSDIRLSADKTLRANLVATPEEVRAAEVVVQTGPPPVVDVGSAEAGSVVSRDFVAGVPVGRTFVELSGTVPQSTSDPFGVGFSGAQSPENGYLLDGFDVTDPLTGTTPHAPRGAPTLLSNFIEEVDVKTGSFLPEYGRSTGGIVNVVTKGGSNEFHGSVFSNLRPDFLVSPNGAVEGADGEAIAWYGKPSAGSYQLDFGGEIGGPILRDKLWFYAGFAPIITREYTDRFQRLNVLNTDPGQASCYTTGTIDAPDPRCRDANGLAIWNKVPGSDRLLVKSMTSYQWAGKLTFLADPNNTLSLATYGQPSSRTSPDLQRAQDENAVQRRTFGSYDVVGRYAGKFLDRHLVVEVDAGWHGQRFHAQPNEFQASRPAVAWSDPASYYGLTAFEPVGGPGCDELARCPVSYYRTGGWGPFDDRAIDRFAGKASVSWLFRALGFHVAKLGVDLEHNRLDQVSRFSGGYTFTARGGQFRGDGYGYLANGEYTSDLSEVFPTPSLQVSTRSNDFSYFLQDSWQVADTGLTVNAGVRLETQHVWSPANPVDQIRIDDGWGPRVQAIWDFTGAGRGKVSASWGRFYWAIPLGIGGALGSVTDILFREPVNPCFPQLPQTAPTRYFPGGQVYGQFDTAQLVNPTTGLPACSTLTAFTTPGSPTLATFHQFSQTATPVMPGLQGTAVDMFGGQLEYEVLPDLSVGLEYAGRRLASLVEDMSPDDGEHFFIANPGRNVTWDYGGKTYSAVDVNAYDPVTGRTVAVKFPKPERSYDALTVRMTKNFSRRWLAQASYTWSSLRGNYSGPYLPEVGALLPGITPAYDLPTLLSNANGYLPGDHTHSVKVFGSYTWTPSPGLDVTGGVGYSGLSGQPVSAIGGYYYPYSYGFAYIIQRGFAGRTPFTHQLDLRAALSWAFSPPYQVRLTVDAFNVLNQETVTGYDENYTYDVIQVPQNPGCRGDFVGTPDPAGRLKANCPVVQYLRTVEGRPVTVNTNWGKPTGHQTPFQLRFGLALAF